MKQTINAINFFYCQQAGFFLQILFAQIN